jgi:hypothetical protein
MGDLSLFPLLFLDGLPIRHMHGRSALRRLTIT